MGLAGGGYGVSVEGLELDDALGRHDGGGSGGGEGQGLGGVSGM